MKSTKKKIVKRYNIALNMWEVGYYKDTAFYIIRLEPNFTEIQEAS